MTTIKDRLLASLRDIGADGVADGRGAVITIDALQALDPPVILLTSRPAFLDADGRLVPLPDWLEYSGGALLTGRGQTGEEVQVWYHGDRFNLWIGRYATSDEDDDIELVSDDFPTAPEAWAAAEAWIKEQEES